MPPLPLPARLLAPLLFGFLAACAATPEPPAPTGAGPSCGPQLTAFGAVFEPLADRNGPHACRLHDAVRMTRSSVSLDQPVHLGCGTALRLLRFEEEVLQPAAQRHFAQKLARVRHFGGYACRSRSDNPRYLSEHALGNAIDISGFDLADGTQITVSRHWRDPGPRGAFLRDVARGACSLFHVVLTPKSDGLHRTHFHLDIGRFRRCDA